MKIYFEDGYLSNHLGDPLCDFEVDAGEGFTPNVHILDYLKTNKPNCSIYTNSTVALSNKYCWDSDNKVVELYIRNPQDGEFIRVDQLTDRELRYPHNLFHLYTGGAFQFKSKEERN